MDSPLLDLSFLYQVSDNDPLYISEVLQLFVDTSKEGLRKLEQSVRETEDYEAIRKNAHFLKSSANIVKIRELHANLCDIEALARAATGKEEMIPRLDYILSVHNEAMPFIQAEIDKAKASMHA
jgi:HPt (histidine-containing phosphotransfer) domain-containing protein